MRAHRVLGDEQTLRDLVRREVLVQEQQHLELAGRQYARHLLRDRVVPAAVAHAIEQPARDSARERGLAARDAAQERRDPLRRLRLQEVARRAGANRRQQVLLRVGRGEHDDLRPGRVLQDPRERDEPVHAGHRQVEQHEVGLPLSGLGDRASSVLRRADNVEALLCQKGSERVSRERMVVDDEDAFGHRALIGTARTADKGVWSSAGPRATGRGCSARSCSSACSHRALPFSPLATR